MSLTGLQWVSVEVFDLCSDVTMKNAHTHVERTVYVFKSLKIRELVAESSERN